MLGKTRHPRRIRSRLLPGVFIIVHGWSVDRPTVAEPPIAPLHGSLCDVPQRHDQYLRKWTLTLGSSGAPVVGCGMGG
jgi:hypothetical protein